MVNSTNNKQDQQDKTDLENKNNSAEKSDTTKSEVSDKDNSDKDKKPVIHLDNVQKQFLVGKNIVYVLKDINMKIYPQEFLVILGPSGSGKSTLLNIILGLEPPTSGQVIIRGNDVTRKKADWIAKFRSQIYGIIFQRAEWVRAVNVLQNVALPLSINGVAKKEREEKAWYRLKQLGMDSHAQYAPTELSGGQQQKVTLARALINDPDIVVADEPTGNLDSNSAEKVMNLFKDLNENEKKTILVVTHNIDYVRYASRTIYIRDGQIIQGSEQFLASS